MQTTLHVRREVLVKKLPDGGVQALLRDGEALLREMRPMLERLLDDLGLHMVGQVAGQLKPGAPVEADDAKACLVRRS